ncbi:receptor for retinol uptake stra6-like [Saccostrea echinata]|uniref:receptor for retinol uptake stra6-like n=1 Tax=Saccostrea echinata TaxID=191078 RepID=UPI002A7F8B57|nr:receptor for retinol uptake stra6-like [Saccostrea echinata]
MNSSNISSETGYYYAPEVARNLRKAFREAWEKEVTHRKECEDPIDHQDMYVFLLIPAVLIITFLFVSKLEVVGRVLHGKSVSRKPKDTFGSDRFSFAAIFGALTFLCFEIAVKRRYVVRRANDGPLNVQILGAVVSIIVYTLDYFPLLTALADKTVIGDMVGTLYIWTMTSLFIIQRLGCYGEEGRRLVLFIQNIPIFMCLVFLAVSFPARLILSVRKILKKVDGTYEEFSAQETDSIRQTPQGRYVQSLLKKRPKETLKNKVASDADNSFGHRLKELMMEIRTKVTYKNIPEFRYSLRMMGVVVIGVLLIYMISAEVLLGLIPLLSYIKSLILRKISRVEGFSEEHGINTNFTITVLSVTRDVTVAIQVCAILSSFLVFCIGLMNIIHTLISYRQYLMELYRGDSSHIPKRENQNNTDILVGSMQFAGYQIGFVIFAYAVQIVILFFSSFGISLVFIVIKYNREKPIRKVVEMMWPMVVFSVLVRLLQIITAKFVFLQDKGRVMAIRYRRSYLVFLYFTFILDIIIGTMRCPYRLVKAIILGSLTLSRLDHSALSREFETLDTGFRAYVGFLHFENMTSHPVLLTFVRLLLARPGGFEPPKKLKASVKASVSHGEVIISELGNAFWKDNQLTKKARAKHRWHLLYTLHKNPQLQFLRRNSFDWLED